MTKKEALFATHHILNQHLQYFPYKTEPDFVVDDETKFSAYDTLERREPWREWDV